LRVPFERYCDSGEINTVVKDTAASIAFVSKHYEHRGAAIDFLDGLTADFGSWWFNLRPSNTEPLLRLNVETHDAPSCKARVEEVRALIGASDAQTD